MSLPYFPFYVADFEIDTAHLTDEEVGCYLRLLMLCWRTPGCSLPHDMAWIARRLRCDMDTIHRRVMPIMDEFMQVEKGRVFSSRLMHEFDEAKSKHEKRVQAGKKGGRPAKPLKNNKMIPKPGLTNAKAKPKQPEPEPEPIKKQDADASFKKGTRLPEDWSPGPDDIHYAMGKNLTLDQAHREATKFRNYWTAKSGKDAVKVNWSRTWQNWVLNAVERISPQHAKPHPNEQIIQAFADEAGK